MEDLQISTSVSQSQNSNRKKSKKKKSFDYVKIRQKSNRQNLNIEDTPVTEVIKSTFSEIAGDTMRDSTMYPPPLDVYVPKVQVAHDAVSFGLNMYFKKPHKFSMDPNQSGGPLAPNQTFLSQPWGAMGCPPTKQVNLQQHVIDNLKDVVFCRYGMEYLKSFPRNDDLAMGSFRINLDQLMFQKQKQFNTSDGSLVQMSFLKTKGQVNEQPQNRIIMPLYKENSLQFDSVFESGNLALAIKKSENEYDCLC